MNPAEPKHNPNAAFTPDGAFDPVETALNEMRNGVITPKQFVDAVTPLEKSLPKKQGFSDWIWVALVFSVIVAAFCLLACIGRGVVTRLSITTVIEPVEDSTTSLHFRRLHWFVADEVYEVKALPNKERDNQLQWMRKINGEWEQSFYFEEYP